MDTVANRKSPGVVQGLKAVSIVGIILWQQIKLKSYATKLLGGGMGRVCGRDAIVWTILFLKAYTNFKLHPNTSGYLQQHLHIIYYSIYINYGFHTWCKFVDTFFYLLLIGFLILYKECKFKSKIYWIWLL